MRPLRFLIPVFSLIGIVNASALTVNWGHDAPMMPLQMTVAKGKRVQVGYVESYHLEQQGSVLLQIKIERKDGSETKDFSFVIPPVGTFELGQFQGWIPQPGDHICLQAHGYASIEIRN